MDGHGLTTLTTLLWFLLGACTFVYLVHRSRR